MQNILADITAQNWILALFIRDDGERFLLGTGAYEFKKSLQHFQPNTYANDVVELQGTDGQLLAGQVRRTASQPFDGYIADQTINQTETESRRRAFLMFFRKKHFYTVAYILPNGTAIQRRRGYITDAPAVAEMIQRWPEYHVALNFEDPNYYEYAEDEDGNPIYAHEVELAIAGASVGGLVWDEDGLVWDGGIDWRTLQTVQGPFINLDNALDIRAPLSSVELLGNTTQDTLSGKNLLNYTTIQQTTKNGVSCSLGSDGTITLNGTCTADNTAFVFDNTNIYLDGTYTLSFWVLSGSVSNTTSDTAIRIYQASYTQGLTVRLTNGPTGRNSGARSGTYVIGNIRVDSGVVFDNYQIRIQLEKNSERTDFEPYCGGIPAPNPTFPIAVQTTTGEQVVKMRGKNLFEYPYANTTKTTNGITFTDNGDGTISASGTATADAIFWLDNDVWSYSANNTCVPAGAYTISKTGDGDCRVYVSGYGKTQGLIGTANSGASDASFTVPEYASLTSRLVVKSGKTVNGFIFKPQLELGSTATDFEPYQSQSYEVNLGKNLFDKDNAEIVHIYNANSESKANASAWSIILPCEPNRAYTYSNTAPSQMKSDSSIGFYEHKPTDAGIAKLGTASVGQNASATFTTPAGTHWMLIYYNWASSDKPAAYAGMMIERGSKATDYAPYFTPIELCKLGTYQDKIYKSGDDWFIHKAVGKYTFDNSALNWSFNSQVTGGYVMAYASGSPFYHSISVGAGSYQSVCSHFTFQPDGTTWTGDGKCGFNFGGAFWCINSAQTTLPNFLSWLGTAKPTVYYALATATDTQITNQALIDQLDALASSTLFVGENNIALVPSGGAQGELKIIYPTDYALTGGAIWAIGGSGGQNIITVDGVDSAFPVWEVVGPATNPILTNTTTGQSITWNGTVPNGQSLVVDMGEQTATMAGANVFQYIDGQWIRLDAGNNTLTYTATGATAPSILSWNGVVG